MDLNIKDLGLGMNEMVLEKCNMQMGILMKEIGRMVKGNNLLKLNFLLGIVMENMFIIMEIFMKANF